jgi:hypothetical protein
MVASLSWDREFSIDQDSVTSPADVASSPVVA